MSKHDVTTCDCTHCEASRDVDDEDDPLEVADVSFNVITELVPVLRRHLSEEKEFSFAKELTKLWHPSKPKVPVMLDTRWKSFKDFHWQEIRGKDTSKILKSKAPRSKYLSAAVPEIDFSTSRSSAEPVFNLKRGVTPSGA